MKRYMYLNFMSVEEAQGGLNILCKAAADNNGFLSYNEFRKIVYGKPYNCDPRDGWTLEMLQTSEIEPNYHMYVLKMPVPEFLKE